MFFQRLDTLVDVLENCDVTLKSKTIDQNEGIIFFHRLITDAKNKNGKIYVIGNGGSAGIASHFSNDILKALEIPSSTLSDSNVLTCFANDYGYDFVYSKPLSILMTSNDLLVAISSSGKSKNIINASVGAKELGAKVVTLSGFNLENPLRQLGDLNFWAGISDYGLVEAAHFFILHTVVDLYRKNKNFEISSEKKLLKELCQKN